MPCVFYSVFLLIILFSQSFAAGGHCGTMQFAENLKNIQKKLLAKEYDAESQAFQVYSRKSQRFIIYYTTEGPHAIKTLPFIDRLESYLEQAYALHKDTLGMKGIAGATQTAFYKQRVPAGLYPVEVMDAGIWDKELCGTYGLVFAPDSRQPRATQISIENDFIFGVNCPRVRALQGDPFTSGLNGDYSKKWDLALKVTVFHELYHSFQFSYGISEFKNFWLEASATGVEEIGAPEVNDYIGYIRNAFRSPGITMECEGECSQRVYGYAPLYLFLFSSLGPKFDSYLWSSFSKYPKEKFSAQLARLTDSLGIDAEELFHEYARKVFLSGPRVSPESSFWPDQYMWPDWSVRSVPSNFLPAATVDFVRKTNEQKPNTDSATISSLEYGDSSVWVLSRILEKKIELAIPKEFMAYPNPWNPKKNPVVYFGNLPLNAKGVEIRSANGVLVERIERKTNKEEPLNWQPKRPPTPGIMYYRVLPNGKNKVLIAEW
ncbi:MAG: hypothetical protein LBH25_13630 [Fibromonadaceae bacterium]|nr:hypothetical protein [Fibromonadaceae bacterium]